MPTGKDVTLPATGAAAAGVAYASLPARPTRGIVVVHEIFGRSPEIDGVVDRFAAQGYAAVAPVLFKSLLNPVCIRRTMLTMSTGAGPFVDRIRGARAWLCQETGLQEDQIGLIGFCLGGGFALASGSGWAAVSTNYGDVPKGDVMKGIGPVIGCYGGRDVPFAKTGQKLERALAPLGVEVRTHTYPTAGHAFLTDGHHPVAEALFRPILHVRYDPAVAEDAWSRILEFMDRHLARKDRHAAG